MSIRKRHGQYALTNETPIGAVNDDSGSPFEGHREARIAAYAVARVERREIFGVGLFAAQFPSA